jgi:hypothetical protein
MGEDEPVSRTVKYGGATMSIGSGNAIAYFGLEYLSRYKGITFADPVVAMAMAGALVSLLFVELGQLTRGLKYVFDRLVPARHRHHDE